jgi:peptide/nickel transport system ATP-binding protein/oligopeptide transport system ATP-binding protein
MNKILLSVQNLKTVFYMGKQAAPAVDDVSFDVFESETLGLVGESGCGKSVSALSILRLIPSPPGKIEKGKILFEGKDLLTCSQNEMQKIRGNRISMIFQDPMTSLNPVYKCGDQISETLVLHQKLSKAEARNRSIELLRQVGIPSPEKRVDDYPHQMSGGMRQRVMIAMAIACDISLLIADEPTTALDVTVQAQILALLNDLREKRKMSMLLITHDLGVVAETAEKIAVMYAGKIQETATTGELFANPKHPYTQGLLRSIPQMKEKKERLDSIPGMVPSPACFPSGCRFHPRWPSRFEPCSKSEPELKEVTPGHFVRCFLY